jgi:DNA repair exonuclease SbcCD ATPase subunit
MSASVLAWILVAALLVVAGGLILRLRNVASAGAVRERERGKLAEKLAAAEKRFEERARSQRKRGEEVAELRKKLEKARRRAAQVHGEHRGEVSELRELRTALERSETERKHTQRELDHLRDTPEIRPVVVKPAPPPPPVPAAPPSAELTALRERAEKADSRAGVLEKERVKLREEVERYKRKARAIDDAYRAQRGELEVKKDRLRTQREELERLRALKVTLVDPPPGD